jgi:hypothetical protein
VDDEMEEGDEMEDGDESEEESEEDEDTMTEAEMSSRALDKFRCGAWPGPGVGQRPVLGRSGGLGQLGRAALGAAGRGCEHRAERRPSWHELLQAQRCSCGRAPWPQA